MKAECRYLVPAGFGADVVRSGSNPLDYIGINFIIFKPFSICGSCGCADAITSGFIPSASIEISWDQLVRFKPFKVLVACSTKDIVIIIGLILSLFDLGTLINIILQVFV